MKLPPKPCSGVHAGGLFAPPELLAAQLLEFDGAEQQHSASTAAASAQPAAAPSHGDAAADSPTASSARVDQQPGAQHVSAASGAAESQLCRPLQLQPAAAAAARPSAAGIVQVQSSPGAVRGSHSGEPIASEPQLDELAGSGGRIAGVQHSAAAAAAGLAALHPDLSSLSQQTAEWHQQQQQQQQQHREEDLASAAAVVRAVIVGPITAQHACVSQACLG